MGKRIYAEALELIHNRKSVRSFTDELVSKEDLLIILKAGMDSPSAVNFQPWNFVVVTEKDVLNKLAEGLPYAKMLRNAGAAIIVCALPEKAFDGSIDYAVIDSTLATENILLATEALGLGAVWTASYPDEARMNFVRSVLDIPENIIPLNIIPVGHPSADEAGKNKFKEENIHWDKW